MTKVIVIIAAVIAEDPAMPIAHTVYDKPSINGPLTYSAKSLPTGAEPRWEYRDDLGGAKGGRGDPGRVDCERAKEALPNGLIR